MDFIKKDEEQFVLQNYSLTVHYYPNMNASEQSIERYSSNCDGLKVITRVLEIRIRNR